MTIEHKETHTKVRMLWKDTYTKKKVKLDFMILRKMHF